MGFRDNARFKLFLQQAKINLIYMAIGFAVIMALGFGFIVMILAVMSIPLIRWWARRQINKNSSKYDNSEYIEVEYEVVGDDIDENKRK